MSVQRLARALVRQTTSRALAGSLLSVATVVVLSAAMIPLRSHLSVATPALVLVVPVVAGATAGGLTAGLVAVAAGFLAYDLAFIPPYWTLSVGAAQNWVALVVYVLVVVLVARVVGGLDQAREAGRRSAADARRLFAMSDLLVEDRPLEDLLSAIVSTLKDAFSLESAALLLPGPEGLQIVASAGRPVDEEVLARLEADSRLPVPMRDERRPETVRTLALTAADRPVGILLLRGGPELSTAHELMRTFANHAAIALERAQLRQQAVRAELLEEVERLRRALVGAVSHDLRTPLATIKVASTTLLDPAVVLSKADRTELLGLVDLQTDRLTRLVNNLLDMTRIQAGVLEVRRQPWDVVELVEEALEGLRPLVEGAHLEAEVDGDLPMVEVDHLLIEQVLANLVDNAGRHAPEGSVITVGARRRESGEVEIYVEDHGPGVPVQDWETVFDAFVGFDTGARAGLGLAIAKAFVEAHGQQIWVESAPGGGARFAFTLPALEPHLEAA